MEIKEKIVVSSARLGWFIGVTTGICFAVAERRFEGAMQIGMFALILFTSWQLISTINTWANMAQKSNKPNDSEPKL